MRCICIVCITIDFVIRMGKKNYPQGYLEEWKYNVKKKKEIQTSRFINAKLKSDSESDSEPESKSGTEIMALILNNSFVISFFNSTFFLVVILLALNK